MVCYGLCAIAETEVHAGQVERAAGTVAAISNILHEINLLVADDPRQVPVRDLKKMLAELDRTFAQSARRRTLQVCTSTQTPDYCSSILPEIPQGLQLAGVTMESVLLWTVSGKELR
jgi:hypothetical protein